LLPLILYQAVLHRINMAVRRRAISISKRHNNKLARLCRKQHQNDQADRYVKQTVTNLSSYQLTEKEKKALSFGLDHHIPSKKNKMAIQTEFERFYQSLLRNVNHIPDHEYRINTE